MSLTDLSQVSTETVLQLIGSTQTVGAETPTVDELDASGNIYRCHGTTVPTNATAGYSKPGYFNKTNAAGATPGAYQNIGTTSSCQFVLLDTAAGGAATSLIDSNGNTALDTGATASAVNNLRVTNSATGAVSANAVLLSAVGTDAAVSMQVSPKGATGILTLGLATGTGDVVVGSSSGTQTVKIGNGAGVSTVNLANTSVAGANVNVATAATGAGVTDTIAIATGNAAATGVKVVNIATGTPGTSGNNRVTVGGGATTKVTLNATVSSYQAINYIASETGSNNAIAGALTDASGTNVTLAAGLRVTVLLAHSLQAGANAFVFNTVSKSIKSHRNTANDIGTAYVSGGSIDLMYDGTQWQDMSQ